MMKKTLLALALCSISLAHADDRALLIGVGTFSAPSESARPSSLNGTDTDLAKMRRLASEWGFNNIRELKNEQATSTNLKKVFDEFITCFFN